MITPSDIEITEEEVARGVELAVMHSAFRNVGDLTAKCDDCDFVKRGGQSTITAAARRHVRANPTHAVWTTRVQMKVTRMRKATVLR